MQQLPNRIREIFLLAENLASLIKIHFLELSSAFEPADTYRRIKRYKLLASYRDESGMHNSRITIRAQSNTSHTILYFVYKLK